MRKKYFGHIYFDSNEIALIRSGKMTACVKPLCHQPERKSMFGELPIGTILQVVKDFGIRNEMILEDDLILIVEDCSYCNFDDVSSEIKKRCGFAVDAQFTAHFNSRAGARGFSSITNPKCIAVSFSKYKKVNK